MGTPKRMVIRDGGIKNPNRKAHGGYASKDLSRYTVDSLSFMRRCDDLIWLDFCMEVLVRAKFNPVDFEAMGNDELLVRRVLSMRDCTDPNWNSEAISAARKYV